MEQRHNVAKKLVGEFRAAIEQLIGIDAKIADVVLERAQTDGGVLKEIPFTQLEEPAKVLEDLQVAANGFTGQGVQYDIDPFALRVGQDALGKVEVTRVVDVFNTQHTDEIPLFFGAGGGEDFCPQMLGKLNSGNTYPARSTMN